LLAVVVGAVFYAFGMLSGHLGNSKSGKEGGELAESIDGTYVLASVAAKRPYAVVIENHPDARPQSGLADADLVYESLTEGGITRYLAFFQTKEPNYLGPIRSARTYFAQIADEWHAIFAHVGGNSDVLKNLRDGAYPNLSDEDEYFNTEYFHRIGGRVAPHNVYTSIEKLSSLAEAKSYFADASYAPFTFKTDGAGDEPAATAASMLTLDFSFKEYKARYQYQKDTNDYARYLAGAPDYDTSPSNPIVAKNIIVAFVAAMPTVTDTPESEDLKLEGRGDGYVFRDGQAIKATWKKSGNKTRYYDLAGREIAFNRGVIWIELVPLVRQGSVTWK